MVTSCFLRDGEARKKESRDPEMKSLIVLKIPTLIASRRFGSALRLASKPGKRRWGIWRSAADQSSLGGRAASVNVGSGVPRTFEHAPPTLYFSRIRDRLSFRQIAHQTRRLIPGTTSHPKESAINYFPGATLDRKFSRLRVDANLLLTDGPNTLSDAHGLIVREVGQQTAGDLLRAPGVHPPPVLPWSMPTAFPRHGPRRPVVPPHRLAVQRCAQASPALGRGAARSACHCAVVARYSRPSLTTQLPGDR